MWGPAAGAAAGRSRGRLAAELAGQGLGEASGRAGGPQVWRGAVRRGGQPRVAGPDCSGRAWKPEWLRRPFIQAVVFKTPAGASVREAVGTRWKFSTSRTSLGAVRDPGVDFGGGFGRLSWGKLR